MNDWELNNLKQNLKDYADRHLAHSKGNLYCCPACGSGTKDKKTGALGIFEKDGTPLFKCQSCGATGSIIDLIMINEGKDLPSAIKRLRELYDPGYNPLEERNTKPMTKKQEPTKTETAKTEATRRDFKNYYKKWHRRINETDYPQRRGLDDATVRRFNLGYEPAWISPTGAEKWKNGTPPTSPRLIIPVDDNHYTARDTRPDEDIPEEQKPFKKQQEGKDGPLFNQDAMFNKLCFFCCEGEIDAMSIEQAGGPCVAYRSTGNKDHFCRELGVLDATKIGTVIIVQDNDKAGKEASDYIEKFCQNNGFSFIRRNVSGKYKDPNEYLVNERLAFEKTVKDIIEEVRRDRVAEYLEKNSTETAVTEFLFKRGTEGRTIPTGFPILDNFLDGGLHPGLYFLGAVSSIGKTTFCLQVAENVASKGRDVLFFSLEQSKEDLISKSLSRRTYEKSLAKYKTEKLAKTNISILRRETWTDYSKWSEEEWDNFLTCGEELKKTVGRNLIIIEAVGDYGVDEIAEDIKTHIEVTGRKPLVFIDYLQIMKPYNDRMADKQNVDRTTSALKRLSRDHDLTIVAVSSFNRMSYWQQVNMTSFKESGSVEYSSDVLLALSPAGMVDGESDADKKNNKDIMAKTKVAKVRNIELHVLKNRNGQITSKTKKLIFDYTAMFNHFKEVKYDYLDNFKNGNPSM